MENVIHIFHADSLTGPMKKCKDYFESLYPDLVIHLTAGRSKELAEQIVMGNPCDIAAFSDPKVIREELIEKGLATWSLIFSTNQLVIITQKGNPLNITNVTDLTNPDVKLAIVTGEKDLATYRIKECLRRASIHSKIEDLLDKVLGQVAVSSLTIPEAVKAVRVERANTGIVYLSAALPYIDELQVIDIPEPINLCDQIQNAVTIPKLAVRKAEALSFVQFLLTEEGKDLLRKSGQPPQIPPIIEGNMNE